jgi:ABC-type nitrate/sulfonate/bicarbonate transport system substrate-binding protein
MERFDFVLDWLPNVQFAGPCLALAEGFYRSAGLDLRLIPWFEDGQGIIDRTRARAVPAAGSAEDNLVIKARVGDGLPVSALAAMFQTTPLVVMSLPGSGIARIQDLAGKRVAMHCDGIRILEVLLAEAGVGLSDLDLVEVTHDLGNLTSGRWDAVQGYAVSEPLELASRGIAVETLTLRSAALHPYAQVVFADDAAVAATPDLYRALLSATFAGWHAAIDDPEAALRAIRAFGAPMDNPAQERIALDRVLALVRGEGTDGAVGLGRIAPARWASNVASYGRAGIVPDHAEPDVALKQLAWTAADRVSAVTR